MMLTEPRVTDRSDPHQRAWVARAVQAIEADANRPQWLVTEAGVGYRLKT